MSEKRRMVHPNPDMLLYIGMGDAYAAAVEYLPDHSHSHPLVQRALLMQEYLQHPTHEGHAAGRYTDDTEMSVANARALIDPHYQSVDFHFVLYWLREFVRGGKRSGYSQAFQQFLTKCVSDCSCEDDVTNEHVQKFLAEIQPDSRKNGGCMRAVPFGVIPDLEHCIQMASEQAAITHNTPEGLFSARVVAAMSHFALYSHEPLSRVGEYCFQVLTNAEIRRWRYVFENPWRTGTPVKSYGDTSVAITTVHAVCSHLRYLSSLEEIMCATVLCGGDADSVAAIAWGIASARYRDETLPDFLHERLEGGNLGTGRSYLATVGLNLMQKFA